MHFAVAAVVTGVLLRPAVATFGYGGWGSDFHYSTPDNTDNKCSTDQTKGYNWVDLASGPFDSYGSNKFSKWSCTNSFDKRDLLTKRTFESKCISSNLDDEPSIGCNGGDSMSIDKYEVSSSEDADIECHYEMPDKTVCKEYHSCKSGGTTIQNTQCGGAKSVTFKPAKAFQGKGCNIGVHSIGFNCGAASTTVPAYPKTESISTYASSTPLTYGTTRVESSTEAVPTSSAVEITTDATPYTSPSSTESATSEVPSYGSSRTSTCVEGSGASCSSTDASSHESVTSSATSRETSPVEASASDSSVAASSTDTTTTAAASSVSVYPTFSPGTSGAIPSSNISLTYNPPAYSHSSSTIVKATSPASASSYATNTIYSTTCETLTCSGSITTLTKSYAVSTTVTPVTSPGKESSPVETSSSTVTSYTGPAPSSPALLPRCLNTWMYLTECKSNSDSNCYCENSDFINKVYGCLSSWSQSADNTTNGVSYLMGICAAYIVKNPAIITGCPSTITPAAYTPPVVETLSSTVSQTSTITLQSTITNSLPRPSSTEISPTTPAAVPCTTITYSSQVTYPATYATGSSQGSIIPSSSITSAVVTTITVPRVLITTYTVTESGSTITAPGLGYEVPPTSTAATGLSSTFAAPVTTSWTASAPGNGSSGMLTKSASASISLPSGIVPYEGSGKKISPTGLLIMGLVAGVNLMVVL